MKDEELERVPVHQALTRSNLFLGGDRELVMFSGLIAGTMIFYALEWKSAVVGMALWCFSLFVLRLMAKHDPKMRQTYMRHRQYRPWYPPQATPWRENGERQARQYRDPWKLT